MCKVCIFNKLRFARTTGTSVMLCFKAYSSIACTILIRTCKF